MNSCVFLSSRRRHTRYWRDWSSDVCSSDLGVPIDKLSCGLFLMNDAQRDQKRCPQEGRDRPMHELEGDQQEDDDEKGYCESLLHDPHCTIARNLRASLGFQRRRIRIYQTRRYTWIARRQAGKTYC